ncbi:MAG: GNAT family N-acetyltransferase [Cellulosilyticaceae bacterium]
MKFIDYSQSYRDEILKLAVAEYEAECKKCSELIKRDLKEALSKVLTDLEACKYGKVAIENDKVVGYMIFCGPWEGFHGNAMGVFSPLGASAFSGSDEGKLASMLFESVSNEMVEDGIIYRELEVKEKSCVKQLRYELVKHLAEGPVFFSTHLQQFENWFSNEAIRVFVAEKSNEIIGYMAITEEAETFISDEPDIQNICGAYVYKEYRKEKVALNLLQYICSVLKAEGVSYMGVDCETMNPTALRFWGKYFESYTYSYARRIDERIVGYKDYIENQYSAL